jgi:hypothetical protein
LLEGKRLKASSNIVQNRFSTGAMVGSDQQGMCKEDQSAEKALANAWKRDFSGLFFAALLILWVGLVLISIQLGHTELWPIIVGLVFFEVSSRVFSSFVMSNPSLFQGLALESCPDFLNTSISLLHSTIIALAVVTLLAREAQVSSLEKMLSHDVLYSKPWPGAQIVLGVSCGYFAYDQWDMLQKHLYNPRSPSLLIHHAVLLTCFTPAIYLNRCINYLILTLVCEVHSVFLHLRKVRKLSLTRQSRSSWGTSIMWFLNWIAYFITRLAFHIYITIKLLQDASKFPKGFEWPMALTGMLGLNVLNFSLGHRLLKAYRKEQLFLEHQH